jgi:hypothetical protein
MVMMMEMLEKVEIPPAAAPAKFPPPIFIDSSFVFWCFNVFAAPVGERIKRIGR